MKLKGMVWLMKLMFKFFIDKLFVNREVPGLANLSISQSGEQQQRPYLCITWTVH